MKITLAGLVCALLLLPATAAADGLPVTGLDGSAGVVSPDGRYRTVSFTSGRNTVLARIHIGGGDVARFRTIPGRLSVPAVAYDLSMTGLSADGRTLALIQPRVRLPEPRTRLALLDAQRLLVRKRITLPGDFSLDAISPDGSKLYLIEYLALSRHGFDPTKYAVRSLDAQTGKLDAAPVVDPHEPDEMGGMPVTRVMSSDGRWAYTLYSGNKHPFIHALDTVGATARCIDLDALTTRNDIFQLRLRLSGHGRQLRVVKDGQALSLVDTRNFRVSAPRAPGPVRAAQADGRDGGPRVWPYALGGVLLLLLIAATARPLARATRAR
jgi:hypothetical protein